MNNPFLSVMAFSLWASVFLVGFSVLVSRIGSQGELLCKSKNIVFIWRTCSKSLNNFRSSWLKWTSNLVSTSNFFQEIYHLIWDIGTFVMFLSFNVRSALESLSISGYLLSALRKKSNVQSIFLIILDRLIVSFSKRSNTAQSVSLLMSWLFV